MAARTLSDVWMPFACCFCCFWLNCWNLSQLRLMVIYMVILCVVIYIIYIEYIIVLLNYYRGLKDSPRMNLYQEARQEPQPVELTGAAVRWLPSRAPHMHIATMMTSAQRTCAHDLSFYKTYGSGYKYKAWIKVPGPHTIHTPWSIPRSIPHDTAWSIPLIHTLDPYPFLVEERLMLALMLLFNLILLLVLVLLLPLLLPLFLLLPPLPPLAASFASFASVASVASVLLLLLLLLLPLLVISLPGAAATAVASAAAPAGPAPAAGADSLPPCASGSWTNATSWLATSLLAILQVPLGR